MEVIRGTRMYFRAHTEFLTFADMASIRQEKVANLIKQELSMLFQREARNLFGGAMITVTIVRMSPDLGVAKVYLSLFGVKEKDAFMKSIVQQHGNIRRLLGQKVGKQLRGVPEMHFYLDDSLDVADRIDDLLES